MSTIPPSRGRQGSGDTPPVPPAGESAAPNANRKRGAISARARSGGAVREKQRASRAVLIAVGIHLVVGVVLLQVLTFGHGIPSWLRFGAGEQPLEERLTYVAPRVPPKPVALATAVDSMEGLEPSKKLLNILGLSPPRAACSGDRP